MTNDVVVEGEALASAAGRFAAAADRVLSTDQADDVASAGAGLPGTASAAACQTLAIRLAAGLAAYAVGVSGLAEGTVEAVTIYREADEHVLDEIIEVTRGG